MPLTGTSKCLNTDNIYLHETASMSLFTKTLKYNLSFKKYLKLQLCKINEIQKGHTILYLKRE